MQIGRNDPCPCGSGKKYKKCCLTQQTSKPPAPADTDRSPFSSTPEEMEAVARAAAEPDDLIAPGEICDYGQPELSREFFDANPVIEGFTPQRTIYSMMLKPSLALAVTKVVQRYIFRGREEGRRIKAAASAGELIEILKRDPDPLNHELLIERLLEYADEAAPAVIADLLTESSGFAELGIQFIHRTGKDCSAELIALINSPAGKVYNLSLACLLLGMYGQQQAIKPLWDCFHYFKEKYPDETYLEGPLIGLEEISHQTQGFP